jgi:hypothetical protein
MILTNGRVNPLFVEDPASCSWGVDQPNEKESEINAETLYTLQLREQTTSSLPQN